MHYWSIVCRSVFRQRWLSVLCIISVSLAVAVTCILSSASTGLTKTLVQQVKLLTGDYSLQIMNSGQISIDDKLKIKRVGYTYGSLKEHNAEFGIDTVFAESDNETLNMLGVEIISGRKPQLPGEVLISEQLLKLYGKDDSIPQKVNLTVASKQNEATVVGIYKNRPAYANDTNTAVYLGKTTFTGWMVSQAYKNNSIMISYYDQVNPITETNSIKQELHIPNENIKYNSLLLETMGYLHGVDAESADVFFIVIAVILLIAIFFMVYSAYNISVVSRTKQLGMMRSIGATPGQVGLIVFLEALTLFIVALPIGWLVSYMGIRFVVPAVAAMLPANMVGVENTAQVENLLRDNTNISVFSMMISAVLGLATLLLSVLIPAKNASRVSPICALSRETSNDVPVFKRKGQIGKHLYYKLALIEQKRNHKRTSITLISLSMGIVIFLIGVGLSPMMNSAWDNLNIDYDYQITSNSGILPDFREKGIEQKEIKMLSKLPGVQEINPSYFAYIDSDNELSVFVVGRSDRVINNIIKDSEIGITINDMKDKNYGLLYIPQEYDSGKQSALEPGDIIKIQGKEIFVGGLIKKIPLQISIELTRPYLLLSEDVYINLSGNDTATKIDVTTQKNITDTHRAEIENKLKQLKSRAKDASYISALEAKEDIEQSMNNLRLLILVIIAIILFIAVMNVMNTMFTSLHSRKKEIGMLRAIGITPGGLNKMLYTEAVLLGVKATILGGLLGIPLAYLVSILADSKLPALSDLCMNLAIVGLGMTALCLISIIFPIRYIVRKGIIQTIVSIV